MNSKPKGKNDLAWEALFSKYDIANQVDMHGKFEISANQIKEYREPRLMAKFDHRINLPEIFVRHSLAILPISRGDYVISDFQAYHSFEASGDTVHSFHLPEYIRSLDARNITSEAIAINAALASGIFFDFLGEEQLAATVSGRMSSDIFDFRIESSKGGRFRDIHVSHSQIEIDAAFEGRNFLALLEAKRDLSEDFLIRQLYYPYRVWASRISKKARPVFLIYSNGVFTLYEYEFEQPLLYNSLHLVKQKNYALEDRTIHKRDLEQAAETAVAPEPEIPFPQADTFKRVINLCELLEGRRMTRDEVTQEYAFDIRQTNYYTDAGRYLGLVEKEYREKTVSYSLSKEGSRIMKLPYRLRQLEICRLILKHQVFSEVFRCYLKTGEAPDKRTIVEIMRHCPLYHVAKESTYVRRASTVANWIHWILELIQE